MDQDATGGLNYDEYKYTIVGFASVDASLLCKRFDANADGVIDDYEFISYTQWKETIQEILIECPLHPSEFIDGRNNVTVNDGAERAWKDSQMDGDENTGTHDEFAQFTLRLLNLLLPHES